jgi:hypothetical protein
MAKIETLVTVPVGSHDKARSKLLTLLGNMGAKLTKESATEIVLKRGSQAKTRLLGGSFIKDSDLPIIASVNFPPAEPDHVHVRVSEHLVVGTTLGMRDKYQRSCTEFAQLLADALR